MDFDPDAQRIRRWNKHKNTSPQAIASWRTLIWRNFSIGLNHDRLMAKIAERVSDKRLLKLIRAFLQAGVMEGGLVSPVDEGTP